LGVGKLGVGELGVGELGVGELGSWELGVCWSLVVGSWKLTRIIV
jgi:hypothetical protein